MAGSPGELLSRRCVNLMKTALRTDMWPRAELKLQWFDKLLMTVVSLNAFEFWSVFFYSPKINCINLRLDMRFVSSWLIVKKEMKKYLD